jgi:hypothetical protein
MYRPEQGKFQYNNAVDVDAAQVDAVVVRVVSEVVYPRHLKSSSMTANKLTRTYKAP